jgi:hypothetical protein
MRLYNRAGNPAFNTAIVWRGVSPWDNVTPIALWVTGLETSADKANDKTGDMVQTYIMRTDMSPLDALQYQDAAICGDCINRLQMRTRVNHRTGKLETHAVNTCYVQVGNAPTAMWKSYLNGNVADVDVADINEMIRRFNRQTRVGAYGDPAMVPFPVWRSLLDNVRIDKGHTAYTHQWKREWAQDFKGMCQASCDSIEEAREAKAMGWGTFTVLAQANFDVEWQTLRRERHTRCPADTSLKTLRKVTCSDCGRCNGQPDMHNVIKVHGSAALWR